jgi:hypothetical protein
MSEGESGRERGERENLVFNWMFPKGILSSRIQLGYS